MSTLTTFPYVVVRLACTKCPRQGQYRLARLVARYGPEVGMVELLSKLAGDCPKFRSKAARRGAVRRALRGPEGRDAAGRSAVSAPAVKVLKVVK